jgi:hypothetical protein
MAAGRQPRLAFSVSSVSAANADKSQSDSVRSASTSKLGRLTPREASLLRPRADKSPTPRLCFYHLLEWLQAARGRTRSLRSSLGGRLKHWHRNTSQLGRRLCAGPKTNGEAAAPAPLRTRQAVQRRSAPDSAANAKPVPAVSLGVAGYKAAQHLREHPDGPIAAALR